MRFRKRPQARIPIRLKSTQWAISLNHEGETRTWHGDRLAGLHRWLLEVKPAPTDPVLIWRNERLIFAGSWDGLTGDGTLW